MKKIAVVALSVLTLVALVSCGKFTCTQCGEEKSGKQYTVELNGKEFACCEDCHELIESASEMLQ